MATDNELANIIIDTGYNVFKNCGFRLYKNEKDQIVYEQRSYQILNLKYLSSKQRCAVGILQDRGVI